MKKYILLLLSVVMLSTSAYAIQRRNITPNQLPASARSYLKSALADQSIRQCTEITDEYKVTYEVLLTNGSTVVFNRDGGWRSISMPNQTVPHDILPADVQTFLQRNYGRNYAVTRIAKENGGYRVTVDGEELLCNATNMQHLQNQIDADSAYRAKHDGLSEQETDAVHQKRVRDRRKWFKINEDGSRQRDTQDKRVKSNGRP